MDYKNKRCKTPSLGTLLYQQVQEQSSMCDVTIKNGLWEKRFHWCVLVASPFFENIHRNNFLEKQTGIIELTKWPASHVECSLLFLYGRKPKVTEKNVDQLLDIAEFLLIPRLKEVCINWLERAEVTVDNCMHLLELSSVYEFQLEYCERFILAHLPDVLEQEGMLNATTESVKMLLADATLSYVPVQSWFNFIIRWTKAAPERQSEFDELFRMLDFGECGSDFINDVVTKEPLVEKNKDDLEKILATCGDDHNDVVIIIDHSIDSLTCLNLRTMVWHRLDIALNSDDVDMNQFKHTHISGVRNRMSSYIYAVNQVRGSFSVLTHNLSNAESSVTNVVFNDTDDNGVPGYFHKPYSLANDMLVSVFDNKVETITVKTNRASKVDFGAPSVRRAQRGRSRQSTKQQYQYACQERKAIRTSTLYIGRLVRSLDTEMHAILTIKEHEISNICCGDNGTIAMLSSDKDSLFIYHEPTGKLECIQLKTSHELNFYSIYLAGFRDGFVLYDNDSVVCISRVGEAASDSKYLLKQRKWEKDDDRKRETRHCFDGERWYRYRYLKYRRSGSEDGCLEYVSHEDLITTEEDISHLPWIKLTIPPEARRGGEFFHKVFAVSLPKGTLRCHVNCPHCDKSINNDQFRQKSFYAVDDVYSGDVGDASDYMYDSPDYDDDYSWNQDHDEYRGYSDDGYGWGYGW